MSLPLGLIFWLLAILCLCTGFGNYLKTIEKYRVKHAVVQHGLKTQIVGTNTVKLFHIPIVNENLAIDYCRGVTYDYSHLHYPHRKAWFLLMVVRWGVMHWSAHFFRLFKPFFRSPDIFFLYEITGYTLL